MRGRFRRSRSSRSSPTSAGLWPCPRSTVWLPPTASTSSRATDRRRSSARSPHTFGPGGRFVVVEYDADRGQSVGASPVQLPVLDPTGRCRGPRGRRGDRPCSEPVPRGHLFRRGAAPGLSPRDPRLAAGPRLVVPRPGRGAACPETCRGLHIVLRSDRDDPVRSAPTGRPASDLDARGPRAQGGAMGQP